MFSRHWEKINTQFCFLYFRPKTKDKLTIFIDILVNLNLFKCITTNINVLPANVLLFMSENIKTKGFQMYFHKDNLFCSCLWGNFIWCLIYWNITKRQYSNGGPGVFLNSIYCCEYIQWIYIYILTMLFRFLNLVFNHFSVYKNAMIIWYIYTTNKLKFQVLSILLLSLYFLICKQGLHNDACCWHFNSNP